MQQQQVDKARIPLILGVNFPFDRFLAPSVVRACSPPKGKYKLDLILLTTVKKILSSHAVLYRPSPGMSPRAI